MDKDKDKEWVRIRNWISDEKDKGGEREGKTGKRGRGKGRERVTGSEGEVSEGKPGKRERGGV